MSGLHYKKDGTLDMRYSSSRQAATASASPSYSSRSGGGLHYKKDGTFDMRYSSSKQAASAVPPSYSSGGGDDLHYKKDGTHDTRYLSYEQAAASASPSYSSGGGGDLHYKKDGTLDMRYSSSKQAATAATAAIVMPPPAPTPAPLSQAYYKKDGTLDMRYSSSKQAAASVKPSSARQATRTAGQEVHLNKDGSLDMRYSSSKKLAEEIEKLAVQAPNRTKAKEVTGVPSDVPVTKAGLPDLRTVRGKQWVTQQAQAWHLGQELPSWVPRHKDGAPDMTKAAARQFIQAAEFGNEQPVQPRSRDEYYQNKLLQDRLFEQAIERQRREVVSEVVEPPPLVWTSTVCDALAGMGGVFSMEYPSATMMTRSTASFQAQAQAAAEEKLPDNVRVFDYKRDLAIDESAEPLGRGGFGFVMRGTWLGIAVAVKKLHLSRLAKKDRRMFERELRVLAVLGEHPNIVRLYGCTLEPPSLVMEFVPRGSLNFLLHYSEDPAVEAAMTDGRIKLNLLRGIAHGMAQLHACGVTHGDLKPQNVLVTNDYHAKLADFGLAVLRAKTTSTISTHVLDNDEDLDTEGIAGGTAAYMAPELLDGAALANEKTDVYSFGVLFNELLQEEEPYQQQLRQFIGKGPLAAVLYAKEGHRPVVRADKITPQLRVLLENCWSGSAANRPSFAAISKYLAECSVPDAC